MKNEDKAVKLFQGVTDVGDDLIEEAGTARKRKKMTPWRGAAIAACLCLALVGTAAAARFAGVWMVDAQHEDMRGVQLGGGITCYPVDVLSEEVRALDGAYALKSFKSWENMENFIGVDLMDNPVLDASPNPNRIHIYRDTYTTPDGLEVQDDVKGRFFARVSALLKTVHAVGFYEIEDVEIEVNAILYTERATDRLNEDESYMGVYFQAEEELIQETYTTPNGLEVQIAWSDDTGNKSACVAAFSINGIPFSVVTLYQGNVETNREVLKTVLDGFQV